VKTRRRRRRRRSSGKGEIKPNVCKYKEYGPTNTGCYADITV
jgi:hypothetical protein